MIVSPVLPEIKWTNCKCSGWYIFGYWCIAVIFHHRMRRQCWLLTTPRTNIVCLSRFFSSDSSDKKAKWWAAPRSMIWMFGYIKRRKLYDSGIVIAVRDAVEYLSAEQMFLVKNWYISSPPQKQTCNFYSYILRVKRKLSSTLDVLTVVMYIPECKSYCTNDNPPPFYSFSSWIQLR